VPARKARTRPQKKSDESYEDLVRRLEASVERLEGGELSLDQALAAYEEGVTLAAQCQKLLDAAQQRIESLREDGQK
jgi:exodeoxyribonuclease VII small subunit